MHRLGTRWLWELRADWSSAPHCHAVNPHHMVQPLGLLTDELGEQVYRLLFQCREGRSSLSGEKPEAPATTFASQGRTFFFRGKNIHLLMRLVSTSTSLTLGVVL